MAYTYPPAGMQPGGPMLQPQMPMQTQNSTLYVGNLDKTVTENLIFDRFSRYGKIIRFSIMRDKLKNESRGFAFIEFQNIKDAEAAKSQLNNEKLATRYIRVMWKGDHKKASTEANVHVKQIDPKVTQNELENYFQQFGPVLSAFLSVNEKGESNRYGYIQYKAENDAQRCLEEAKSRKLVVGESPVTVEVFQTKQEREVKRQQNMRNLYLRDLPVDITEEEIRKVFEKFGTVKNLIVGKPAEQSSAYSLVALGSRDEAQRALEELEGKDKVFKNQTKPFFITWHKNKHQLREERNKNREQERDKTIYMRNLKADTKKEDVEAVLKGLGTLFGWMSLRPFEATENPQSSIRYKCQSAVIKMNSNDHVQTVLGAKDSKEMKALFINEKPFVDIAMPKADRERMKQIQHRHRMQMPGMGAFPAPQFMRLPQMPQMYPQQFPPWVGMPPQPFPRGGNFMAPRGRGGRGGRGGPMGGAPGGRPMPGGPRPPMQQHPGGYPSQHTVQNQRQPQQRPAQPEAPKKLDIEMIRKNLANFKAMKPEEKRNILGEFLYPKVSKEIGHHLAPKITGMLVDFEVMTEEEILEAIDDEAILKQRITEAKEALEEADTN